MQMVKQKHKMHVENLFVFTHYLAFGHARLGGNIRKKNLLHQAWLGHNLQIMIYNCHCHWIIISHALIKIEIS